MISVGVVMIVKNEEAMLARCLDSVRDADEIVICDTGSQDGTLDIAKRYTDKVFTDYTWEDSFCKARNHAKSKSSADWILSIDADEHLTCAFSDVRQAADLAFTAVDCCLIAEDGVKNLFPRLFRNSPQVQWQQDAHNVLNVPGEKVGEFVPPDALVKITYGYSPAHALDPERTLRILEQSVMQDPFNARARFYLGREYWYRKRYAQALQTFGLYVQQSSYLAEKAEAFLTMSRIYWELGMGNDARDACAQALIINPNFREAVLFMARLAGVGSDNPRFDANGRQWLRMAETANNSDVLFVREQ